MKDYLKITVFDDDKYTIQELTENQYNKLLNLYGKTKEWNGIGSGAMWIQTPHCKIALCKKEQLDSVKNEFKLKEENLIIDSEPNREKTIDELIDDERKTIEFYQEAMKYADEADKAIYSHIIAEELEHIEELKNLKEENFNASPKDSKVNDVIKEEKGGYVIYSEKGKKLSKVYKTKEEAEKRLKEIEMFKHMNKDSIANKEVISKGLLHDKIDEVLRKYLKSEGFNDRDVDDYMVIDIDDIEDQGHKGIKIEIRNDLVGYYELPDKVVEDLNKIVDPEYFEPWSEFVWQCYIWDKMFKDSQINDNLYHGIEIVKNEDGTYLYTLDDNTFEALSEKEAREAIDDYLYPDRHKTNTSEIEKEEYVVYDPDTENKQQRKAMFWTRNKGGRYMREDEAERFTKSEAEKIEKFKGEHTWVKKLVKDTWIENNDIRTTLDMYLSWEGIRNYTDKIIEVWDSKEAWIDDELKTFETSEEALSAYLEWEGIQGYDEVIKDILEGADAYLDDGEEDEVIKAVTELAEDSKCKDSKVKDDDQEYKTGYYVYYKDGTSEPMYMWVRTWQEGYDELMRDPKIEKVVELSSDLLDNYMKTQKDSTDLMKLVNECKDVVAKSPVKKEFKVYHKKDGQQDKLVLEGPIDFEDTEEEEALVEQICECVDNYYTNYEFKYNDQHSGGYWILKE